MLHQTKTNYYYYYYCRTVVDPSRAIKIAPAPECNTFGLEPDDYQLEEGRSSIGDLVCPCYRHGLL